MFSEIHNVHAMKKITVNHVLSSNTKSIIFDDILGYHKKHSESSIDIIVSITPKSNSDVYVYHRPHLEEMLRNNSIAIVHHDLREFEPCFNLSLFFPRYTEADFVICLNRTQENILREKGLNNTVVIPHGYNPDVFKEIIAPKKHSEGKKVCLGILSKYYFRGVKGDVSILEIAKRLPISDFSFFLVGEGREILSKQLADLGFTSEFVENHSYSKFSVIYDKIDILLITSFYEGGPASVPEAIVTGTPIITTPVGMALDYISDGNNGVFLSGTYDDYAQLIIDSCKMCNLNKLFKQAFLSRYNVMTWSNVVNGYSEIYKRILNV